MPAIFRHTSEQAERLRILVNTNTQTPTILISILDLVRLIFATCRAFGIALSHYPPIPTSHSCLLVEIKENNADGVRGMPSQHQFLHDLLTRRNHHGAERQDEIQLWVLVLALAVDVLLCLN